jgi:hypothetical protein
MEECIPQVKNGCTAPVADACTPQDRAVHLQTVKAFLLWVVLIKNIPCMIIEKVKVQWFVADIWRPSVVAMIKMDS